MHLVWLCDLCADQLRHRRHRVVISNSKLFLLPCPPPFPRPSSVHDMVLTESFPCMILHRRNLACRGCGCPRSENQVTSPHRPGSSGLPSARFPSSPRFVGSAAATSSYNPPLIPSPHYPVPSPGVRQVPASPGLISVKPPSPSHPLLTPSGRAFAVGGKVQNVSSDPLAPSVLYWPDNEPFPEQGQIRPSHLTGLPVRRRFLLFDALIDQYISNHLFSTPATGAPSSTNRATGSA